MWPFAPTARARRRRRSALRCAPLLVAVSLLAAACSSGPVGAVGSTLPALEGTVTLVKVISPAQVVSGYPPAPLGQKLVAVVLTVHAPAATAAKFASIYHNSKLIDSTGLAHVGRSTAKYKITDCASYPPFSTLAAGQAATGCDVFGLAVPAAPVELVISGKAKADWKIAATAVLPGTAAPVPAPVAPPAVTPTTVAPGTLASGGSTTTTAAGASTITTTATTTALAAAGGSQRRHPRHGSFKPPKITRVAPQAAPVGTRVQIWGKHLNTVTEVTFEGVAARVVINSDGKLVVLVPAGVSGGPISVTTPTGTAVSGQSFLVY
jgi:hypothetical protein